MSPNPTSHSHEPVSTTSEHVTGPGDSTRIQAEVNLEVAEMQEAINHATPAEAGEQAVAQDEADIPEPKIVINEKAIELRVYQTRAFPFKVHTNFFHPVYHKHIIRMWQRIARIIQKEVILVDWTNDIVGNQVEPFIHEPEKYYIACCANMDHSSGAYRDFYDIHFRNEGESFPMEMSESQFGGSYSDPTDGRFLNRYPFEKLTFSNYTFFTQINRAVAKVMVDIKKLEGIKRKVFMKYFEEKFLEVYFRMDSIMVAQAKRMTDNFLSFIKNGEENIKRSIVGKISDLNRQMGDQYRCLNRLEKDSLEETRKLAKLRNKQTAFNRKYSNENLIETFVNLQKDKKYVSLVSKSSSVMTATTGPIYLTNYGKSYYVGYYEVEVSLVGTVKIFNLDKTKIVESSTNETGFGHPHVSSCIPCLGNIKEIIPKLIANGEIFQTFLLLYKFLTSYNEGNPYRTLEKYWGEPEDWCTSCHSPTLNCKCGRCKGGCGQDADDCTCDRCSHCEERIDHCCCPHCTTCGEIEGDCGCARCPRENELMSNVDCNICDRYFDQTLDVNDRGSNNSNATCNYTG